MIHKIKSVLLLGLISFITLTTQASADSFQSNALFLEHQEDGVYLVDRPGLPCIGSTEMQRDPAVVWSHYLENAMYNTTSNTVDGYVFAGTWLNPPKEAELFALTGAGTPEWGYGGTIVYTDAGDASFTLAALDDYGTGVYVRKWTGPDSIPDWTADIAGYAVGFGADGPIAVSDDGSTIAIIAWPSGTDAHLLLFDADSSVPLVDYVASGLGFPRYVKINADGRYTAFIALATIVVFDRDSLNVRDQISMGFSNTPLDISADGNLIAYGWPSLILMQWNGADYQNLWSYSAGGGYYLSRVAISNDGSTMVSCWYNLPHNTIKVVVHNTGSSTPLWIYDYPTSSGTVQEVAYDIDITDDGAYFIVGSWGDDANLNPEVHIFQRDNTPHIYYTVDMPGSMFCVDIANDGSYATAAGKHIHANTSGHGGDIVMINTDITGITETHALPQQRASSVISCYPNPFNRTTQIRYTGQELRNSNCEMRKYIMKIYDATGRLVKSFNLESSAQGLESSITWSGIDDANRNLESGVYFLQLETEKGRLTGKVIKAE